MLMTAETRLIKAVIVSIIFLTSLPYIDIIAYVKEYAIVFCILMRFFDIF